MKRLFLLALFFPAVIYAQNVVPSRIEIIHTFSFGNPFNYNPDPRSDMDSGMPDFFWIDQGKCAISGTYRNNYFIFNDKWENIFTTKSEYGRAYRASSVKYVLLGKNYFTPGGSGALDTVFWIFLKENFSKPAYEVNTRSMSLYSSSVYLSGNIVFALGGDSTDDLVTWELLGNGSVKFRDGQETKKWLAEGNAEAYGYSRAEVPYFGTIPMGPLLTDAFLSKIDFTAGKQVGFTFGKSIVNELGRDSKGLLYFESHGPEAGYKPFPTAKTGFYYYGVIDPWQKKAVFRALPTGRGVAPKATANSFGNVGLPRSVDPQGNIYFFEVDVPGKQFVLNQLKNDWWEELKVRDRTVGVVTDNRLRLRDKPNTQGEVLGFLYENEVALILETSAKAETIAGKTASWYRIEMPDGRKGWVFGAFIDIQK